MNRLGFLSILLLTGLSGIKGQVTFPDLVSEVFGSDQVLVNGIQFANHFGQVDGHPYLLDGQFRTGGVHIKQMWYDQLLLRYNLYTQKVEIEYTTREGHRNQFMSVADHISSFHLDEIEFRRMQLKDVPSTYFQVISYGEHSVYVAWRKEKQSSQNDSNKKFAFTPARTRFWLNLNGQLYSFHNRKSFVEFFPEDIKRDLHRLLKARRFSFQNSTVFEAEATFRSALKLIDKGELP